MQNKYTPCGGCGAEHPDDRCIGCGHQFEEQLNPDLLKEMQEAEATKEDDLKKVKEGIGQVRIYFVFKHPKTGEEMSSRLYTPLELLDTDLSIINERTCVCDCKPVGETNVVECNCEDYYQDFQFHSYHVEGYEPLVEKSTDKRPIWVKASEYDASRGGVLFYRFNGPDLKSIGIGHFVGDMFHGTNLDVFPKWDWKYLYILDESGQ